MSDALNLVIHAVRTQVSNDILHILGPAFPASANAAAQIARGVHWAQS